MIARSPVLKSLGLGTAVVALAAAAFAQYDDSTICLGLNCDHSLGLETTDIFRDMMYDRALAFSENTLRFTPERERCFSACRTRYDSEIQQCRRMHTNDAAWPDAGYAICQQAVEDRYLRCLNPFMDCPP